MRNSLSIAAFCMISFLAAVPADAAQMLVIIDAKNAGDKLVAGSTVNADADLTLAAGAELSLLSETGRMVVLKGPYSGKADKDASGGGNAEAPSLLGKISKLITSNKSGVGTGASRDIDDFLSPKIPPHPFFISVAQSGAKCALSDAPELWRANATNAVALSLSDGKGLSTKHTWPAGNDRFVLPKQYVTQGARITADIGGRAVDLHLHVRPASVTGIVKSFAWLAETGCSEQGIAFFRVLRAEAGAN